MNNNTITLPNGIEGKEYIMDLDAFTTISWKIGYWSYFVAARPGQQEGSTRNYASEIIKTIGVAAWLFRISLGNYLSFILVPTTLLQKYTGRLMILSGIS